MCFQFASFINMYLLLCVDSRLVLMSLLIPIGYHFFCLFFIDIHWFSCFSCTCYHPHASRRTDSALRVVRGGAARNSYTIQNILEFWRIGRLALGVQQIVPNIRQCASNSPASLICIYCYVLIRARFRMSYWFLLVPIDFVCFHWYPLIFICFSCTCYHPHASRRTDSALRVARGGAVRDSYTIKNIT